MTIIYDSEPAQRPSFEKLVDMLSSDTSPNLAIQTETKKGIDTADDLEMLKQRILAKKKQLEENMDQ